MFTGGGGAFRLTLLDFMLNTIWSNVVVGAKDRIASVTERPISTLTTPIESSIDRTALFVDDPDGNTLLTGGSL